VALLAALVIHQALLHLKVITEETHKKHMVEVITLVAVAALGQ
jgi:hypothetical protein